MDFESKLPPLCKAFHAAGIRYALIGGLAMAMRGVQRATLDVDFILVLEDMPAANTILQGLGYQLVFHSENVSHYRSCQPDQARIDVLHAFRGPTLGMLDRAESLEFSADTRLPVVHLEDLIGLKVQASVNDPSRHDRDWSDIRMMVQHAARQCLPLDWELIGDYLTLFDLADEIAPLQQLYGHPH